MTEPMPFRYPARVLLTWLKSNLPYLVSLTGLALLNFALIRALGLAVDRRAEITYWPVSPLVMGVGLVCLVSGPVLDYAAIRFRGVGILLGRLSGSLLKPVLYIGVFWTIFLGFLVARLLIFNADTDRDFPDTALYALMAREPLSEPSFWVGERPFTLPMFYKAIGINRQNIWLRSEMRRIGEVQFWLSVLAWTALGISLSSLLKTRWFRPVAFGVFLLFGLSLSIVQWEHLLLSESLSNSLFALWIAICLWGVRLWVRDKPGENGLRIAYIVVFACITILYAFTRDTNAYFSLFTAVLMLFAMGISSIRRNPDAWFYIVLILILFAVFLVQNTSAEIGRRWQGPFSNVIVQRILSDPDARGFFQRNGMPLDENVMQLQGQTTQEYGKALNSEPRYRPLVNWIDQHGKNSYTRFLLSRAYESLSLPIINRVKLISSDSSEYRLVLKTMPEWAKTISRIMYPEDPNWVMAGTVLLVGLLIFSGYRNRFSPACFIPLILVALVYPLMFVVWHGDAIEVERHAAQIGIQLRLAGWMMVILLVDMLVWKSLDIMPPSL